MATMEDFLSRKRKQYKSAKLPVKIRKTTKDISRGYDAFSTTRGSFEMFGIERQPVKKKIKHRKSKFKKRVVTYY